MAIVTGPALSIDASGNMGAICYSKWRGFNIARDVWTGTYPGTDRQIAVNQKMTTVAQEWGGAGSTVDREKWERYAEKVRLINRLGQEYVPTGYGIYMKLNLQRAIWSLGVLDEPLPRIEPEDPGTLVPYKGLMPLRISVRLGPGGGVSQSGFGDDYYRAGPYDSGGRKPISGEWRLKQVSIPPDGYRDETVIEDKWYWYKGRQIWESGWAGNFFVVQVLVDQ